jgi:predicted nucleotidyltransferase
MAASDPAGLCRELNAHGSRYVLIGGHAVGANGYPRATRDTDLLLAPGEENWRRTLNALIAVGATRPQGGELEQTEPVHHLRADTSYGPVDLLEEGVDPLTFEQVESGAMRIEIDDVDIPVCGLAELVAFKRLAGRTRDRADLEELEAVHGTLPLLPLPGIDAPDLPEG